MKKTKQDLTQIFIDHAAVQDDHAGQWREGNGTHTLTLTLPRDQVTATVKGVEKTESGLVVRVEIDGERPGWIYDGAEVDVYPQ